MQQSPQAQEINKTVMQFAGRSLTSGADKIPILEFIGTGVDWDVEQSRFGDGAMYVKFQFSQVQVIKMREDAGPYPHDTASLLVKHSGSLRSGFGFVQGSINKALGIPQDQSDLDSFKGHSWHVTAEQYNWGHIPNSTVADANGDTWGEIWNFALAGSNGAAVAPAVTHATVAPQAQPASQTQAASTAAPAGQSAEDIAFGVLNGKNLADFNSEITGAGIVQQDPDLFIRIMNNSWIAASIASGKVVVNADGTHTVN